MGELHRSAERDVGVDGNGHAVFPHPPVVHLLGSGYDTVYQGTATVRTEVPERYRKLCRMFLRWDRSYIREEIRFVGIV